jgi:hypothetical protein
MSVISFHRRAERFAQLLEEAIGARRHSHLRTPDDEELAPLVAIGDRARRLRPAAEMDPDFRAGLRAMLVATAEREGIGATASAAEAAARPPALLRLTRPASAVVRRPAPATARRARARVAVMVGIAAGTLALSGMSAASGDAVPGDALYGMKRSTERAQLALTGSDISRGQLSFEHAKTRLGEAQAVRRNAARVTVALDAMDDKTRQGVRLLTATAVDRHDAGVLHIIDRFAEAQGQALADLLDSNPPGATERILKSLQLLEDVTARTETVRKALACDDPWDSDALGPLPPDTCGTGAPRPAGQSGD